MKLIKNVWRTLKSSALELAGTVALAALAIMLYVMLSASMTAVSESAARFQEEYNQEDLQFQTAEPLSAEAVKKLEQTYKIEVNKRSYLDIQVKEGVTLRLLSLTRSINRPYAAEGDLPKTDEEIALAKQFADAHSIKPGDIVEAGGTSYHVTGTVFLPDYIYPLKSESDIIQDPESFGAAIVSEEAISAQSSSPPIYYTAVYGEEPLNEKQLKKAITAEAPLIKWLTRDENPRIAFLESKMESAASITGVVPVFILILAMAMVMLVVKRRLELQRKQIGTLMALGYYRREVAGAYMLFPVLAGLAGTAAGGAAGWALAVPLTGYYTEYFNLPILEAVRLGPVQFVLACVLPVFLLSAGGFWTIWKTVSARPLTLLKPFSGTKKARGRITLKKAPFKTRFRFKMLTRNPSKAVIMLLGIMSSAILVSYGFLMMNSASDLIGKTYQEAYRFNYTVYYAAPQSDQPSKENFSLFGADAEAVNGEKINGKPIQIVGMEPESERMNLEDEAGVKLNTSLEDGIILSKALAMSLDAKPGDKLTFSPEGASENITYSVAGVAELYIGESIYMNKADANQIMGLPGSSYTGEWTMKAPDEKDKSILRIDDKQMSQKSFETLLGPTQYSAGIISIFAFIIGFIMISLITGLMVDESAQTISLLKVMGYEDKEISSMLLDIYIPVVVLGYALGVPAAVLSIDSIMKSAADSAGFALPVAASPFMIAGSLAIILLTYWISLQFSKRKLKRVSLQEVLKMQE
ncbi:FtsX-like permease family protein [Metabacillus sp. 84]|uniref:ABC transporter permease n=1 Tax=unclassified Metabacillus TaxID=2675274 RepID=UPI003CF7FD56